MNQDQLKELVTYCPRTGYFTWIAGNHKGKIAGSVDKKGFCRIHFAQYGVHMAHYLAILYTKGYYPELVAFKIGKSCAITNIIPLSYDKPLTYNLLKQLIHYNPKTGVFKWRVSFLRIKRGSIATNKPTIKGYVDIIILGKIYRAHNIAWFYVKKKLYVNKIDHADRNKGNNAFSNLRKSSIYQNAHNRRKRVDNRSGYKGVTKGDAGKWKAMAYFKGKNYYLGQFATRIMAAKAYDKKVLELVGEFACTNKSLGIL